MTFRPMLAATLENPYHLDFPVLASPKLDGIRCLLKDGKALTRKLKPIPNHYVRQLLETTAAILDVDLDGELMLDGGDFNEVQSAIMSHDGQPAFYYAVFDIINSSLHYELRYSELHKLQLNKHCHFIKVVKHKFLHSVVEFLAYEKEILEAGHEGVMIRSLAGKYKFGRSTLNQGWLLKFKRFIDEEATIVGFQEKMHNNNDLTVDALGYAERSSAKANLSPLGTLGALEVKLSDGREFKIGSGFDDATRQEIWNKRDKYLGCKVKFKYQELSADQIPRFPVFLAMRSPLD